MWTWTFSCKLYSHHPSLYSSISMYYCMSPEWLTSSKNCLAIQVYLSLIWPISFLWWFLSDNLSAGVLQGSFGEGRAFSGPESTVCVRQLETGDATVKKSHYIDIFVCLFVFVVLSCPDHWQNFLCLLFRAAWKTWPCIWADWIWSAQKRLLSIGCHQESSVSGQSTLGNENNKGIGDSSYLHYRILL